MIAARTDVRLRDRELDPVWCEIVELRERYAGRSAQRRRRFDLWRSHAYWGDSIRDLAFDAGVEARWVRRLVRRVAAELRALHGPPFGHPVEKYLGYD